MKVNYVCFDFGNTLLHDPFDKVMRYQSKRFQSILKEHGHAFGRDEIVKAWKEANAKMHYPFISHFFQERPIVANMLERLRVSTSPPLISELLIAYRDGLKVAIASDKRLASVSYVLGELKRRGKKLAVLSSERAQSLSTMLLWAKLSRYFVKIMATESIGVDKPDPQVFWFLIRAINAKREEVVYVGDSYTNDIVPAKKFGIKAIWYNRANEQFEMKYRPDKTISDLVTLLDIIE
ncbi:MAG: hypothetical protein DRP03_00915 [Candidatus Aenigmatarchaeota archaeon]|nr:MAG: hypothetical protein DRP03_00915 [Candidatus Aenigmarchaeota archaeon]